MSSIRSLDRAFKVDRAINYVTKEFVIIRFGDATDENCKEIDEWINKDAAAVDGFAEIYKVENKDVPELVARYSLFGPCSIIFFRGGTAVYRLSTANIKKEMQKNDKFGELASRQRVMVTEKDDFLRLVLPNRRAYNFVSTEDDDPRPRTIPIGSTSKYRLFKFY